MASGLTSLDTDRIQVRKIYARTPENSFIPSSHILIANGNGETRWNSVSSILLISSFGVVYGNTSTSILYGDLSTNILQISTTGVGNIFQSYVDPVEKVLMLSNALPPLAVCIGSVPSVSDSAAQNVPNPQFLTPVTGLSTIKYIGVGDIKLSTITGANAMFVSISSFTSAGYSTISGETFLWRPTLYSTLSTTAGFASFISSSSVLVPGTNPPVGVPMSTSGNDLYFSSVTFSTNHLMKYLDRNRTSSTRMFVELQPSFFFPPLYQVSGGDSNVVKEISSYLQLETVISGRVVFETSVNTRYITSQITDTNLSNYFNTPMRMEINPYEIASNVDRNTPNTVNLTVYHRIVNGLSNVANPGFLGPTVNYDDRTSKGLYIQMMSDTQLYP
jgi:hypothetical protein